MERGVRPFGQCPKTAWSCSFSGRRRSPNIISAVQIISILPSFIMPFPSHIYRPRFFRLPHIACALFVAALTLSASCADLWVAVGYGGRRMVSTDGKTWEITAEWAEKGGDDSNNLMSAAYGLGKFVVVGGGGFSKDKQGGHILTSTDGRNWTEVHKAPFRINPVVFGAKRFVAGGPDRTLLWSTDGEKWEKGAQIAADGFPGWAMWFRHGAFGNGTFVMMGEGGAKKEFFWCIASPDGQTSSFRRDLPQLKALAFGAGVFVTVGENVIMHSKDGKDWTRQEAAPQEKLEWIHWTGSGFLCGGKQTYASADGLNWNPLALKLQGRPLWTDGTRFITSQWPGKMSFSPDGTQWFKGNELPPNGINKVVAAGSK